MSIRPSVSAAARTAGGRSQRARTDVVNHRPRNSQISGASAGVARANASPGTGVRPRKGGVGSRILGGAPLHQATAVAGHVGTHGLSFQKDMIARKVDLFPCDHLRPEPANIKNVCRPNSPPVVPLECLTHLSLARSVAPTPSVRRSWLSRMHPAAAARSTVRRTGIPRLTDARLIIGRRPVRFF